MARAAERMPAMRERRRAQGLRELRLVVPDPHARTVLRRVAQQVSRLDQGVEIRLPNGKDWPGEGPYVYRRAAMKISDGAPWWTPQ